MHYEIRTKSFRDQEIKALIRFRHRTLCKYIDFSVAWSTKSESTQNELSVGLVVELCQNLNLADRIDCLNILHGNGPLAPLRESLVVTWICQAADASNIHDQDSTIGPQTNDVFFSKGNEVIKLGDFGLQQCWIGKQSTVGTPYYFAQKFYKPNLWCEGRCGALECCDPRLLTLREHPINSQVLENLLLWSR